MTTEWMTEGPAEAHGTQAPARRARVYYNPESGGDKGRIVREEAFAALRRLGWEGEARELNGGLDEAPDGARVILMGGDGTLHKVLPEIMERDLSVGLIPSGTGNDLARSLGIPLEGAGAAKIALEGRCRDLDVGLINDRPFHDIGSFGIDAEIAARTRTRKKGGSAYLLTALRAVWSFDPYQVKVQWDGGEFEGMVTFVAVANADRYGTGLVIAPEASLQDELLDLVILKAVPKVTLLRLLARLARQKPVEHPAVMRAKTARVRLDSPVHRFVYADGEPVASPPVEFRIGKQKLKVACPG